MKPILFPATATSFTSKGLGTITDAISCYVTEARNGIFDLEMQIPVDSKRYKDIALDKIILAKPNPYDNPQPFRIHKITRPIHGIVTILANHLSYDLKGMPVNAFTATSCSDAVSKLKSSSLITCPFTFTTNIVSSTIMTVARPYTIRDLMGGVEGSLIDTYGGEYKFDKYSVQLLSSRGQNRGVKIKYGINLIDLTQEENCSSVYSGVLPYYASEKGIVVGDVQRASGTYPVDRILPLDLTQYFTRDYDEADTLPTVAQLNTRGAAYVLSNSIGVPKVSLSLSFAQLPRKDVYLCDTVTVEFEKMGIETTAKVIETIYDVLEGRYRSVKIGDPRANIVNSIADEAAARQASGVRMQSYLEKSDSAIRAKVSKIGGSNNSFGWEMNDTSHTWYANEEEVMKANSSGLEIKGKVTAKSGYIGNGSSGFTIGNTAIYNGLSSLTGNTNGIYLGTDGMALGGGKFKVTAAGALKATDADITGKITSSSGEIGGFTIGNSSLYNGMESLTDTQHNGVYVGTNGIALGKGAFKVTSAGAVTASNLELKGGSIKLGGTENNPVFHVTSAGAVTASNLTLTGGSITIKDDNNNVIFSASRSGVMVNGNGTFTGNVYAKNIQYSTSDSSIGTFSGAGITDLSILAAKLQNDTLTTAQMASGIRTSLGYANFSNAVFNNTDTAAHISCSLLTVRGGPVIVSGRVSASYLVGVHKVLSGDNEYDMSIHTHQISESNGVVTIGAADWTGGTHSFNIADTEFYQNAVSAVTVKSYGFEQDDNEETDYTKLYVVLGLNGTTTNTVGNLDISGSYNAGEANAQPRAIVRRTNLATGTAMPDTWDSSANKGYIYLRATTRDNAIYYDANIEVDTNSAIYQAGENATTITAITRGYPDGESSYPYYDSQTLGKIIEFKVTATMSNGQGSSQVLTVPADAAYNAGHTAGVASVTATAPTLDTSWATSSTGYIYRSAQKNYEVRVKSNASNGDSLSGSVIVSGAAAYDAGAQTAYVSAITTGVAGSPSWSSEDSVYYANVSVTATAQGTKADGTYYTADRTITKAVDVTAVYEAGQTSGAANVTLTLTDSQTGFNSTTHKKTVTVDAVVANASGTSVRTGSKDVEVDATSVYNSGQNAGAQTAYVSSITGGTAGAPSWNSEDQVWYSTAPITATARGTKADGTYYTDSRTANTSVDVTAAYNAGKTAGQSEGSAAVTISSIALNTAWATSNTGYVYQTANNRYAVNVKAIASNENYSTQTIYVPASEAYNAGEAAGEVTGAASVTISAITRTYPDGESSYPYYDSPTLGKVIELKVQASMSNGQGGSQILTVPADSAYNAGFTAGSGSGSGSVTISSVGRDTSQNTTYDSSTKLYTIPVIAAASNGATGTGTIQQSGAAAYNAGVSDAEAGVTLDVTASQGEWNSSTHKKTVTVVINAKNSGDTTIETSTQLVQVDATSVYEAGETAGAAGVSCSTIGLDTGWSTSNTGYSYQSSNNRYAVRAKATLSNGVTYSATLYVPDTDAYNAGYTAGQTAGAASVSVTAMQYYTLSGEDTVSYDSTNNTLSASVQATLSNGNTSGSVRTVTIPADLAYNAGAQSIVVSTIGLNTAWETSSTGYIYETANNRFAARVKATLNNGRAWSSTIYIPAADAYNAGYQAGGGGTSVSVSTIALNTSWDQSDTGYLYQSIYNRYAVNVRVVLSNSNAYTGTVYVSASDAYNTAYSRGETAGANGVSVSSMTGLTTSSLSDTYDQSIGLSSSSLYTSGSTQYGRVKVTLSNGVERILRISMPSGGSSSGSITISNKATSSSVNPYYGTLPYYAWVNNRHYVQVEAVATGTATRTQYIDINDIVNYAYQLGGGGGSSGGGSNSVSLYCYSRTENSAGLVTCDFSISSYNGLFWQQGYYYTFYYN